MKLPKCKICNNVELTYFIEKDKYVLKKCTNCTFVFVVNPPSKKYLNKFYEDKDYEDPIVAEKRIRIESQHSLKIINTFCTNQNNLLDIGCGRGYFLDEAKQMMWNVSGIDYSNKAIKFARLKLKLDVNKSDIFSYVSSKKYSIVSLNQVIEHTTDANKLLKKISSLMASNGILYIATPNINSLSAQIQKNNFDYLIPPEHLSYYNLMSLKYLLHNNGYEIVYNGTWSYSAELAGIIKTIFKNDQPIVREKIQSNNRKLEKNVTKVLPIKEFLFDKLFCSFFHPLLDLIKSGSIIEIVAIKK